jgi:hypothetical protein
MGKEFGSLKFFANYLIIITKLSAINFAFHTRKMFLNLTKNLFDKENSEKLSQLSKRIKKDPKPVMNVRRYTEDKTFKK